MTRLPVLSSRRWFITRPRHELAVRFKDRPRHTGEESSSITPPSASTTIVEETNVPPMAPDGLIDSARADWKISSRVSFIRCMRCMKRENRNRSSLWSIFAASGGITTGLQNLNRSSSLATKRKNRDEFCYTFAIFSPFKKVIILFIITESSLYVFNKRYY